MSIFSTNSKLYKFMQKLTDIFVLNFMWILFSIPIVTIGASTVAASSVALKMSEEREGKIAKQFFESFKANIKQGIAMSFISVISVWAVYLDVQIVQAVEEYRILFIVLTAVTGYLLGFSQLYIYPLLARYDNTLFKSLKNSFDISMKYFGRSILLIVVLAAEFVIIFWNYTTMFAGLLLGPGFVIYTVCAMALPLFRKIEKLPETTVDRTAEEADDMIQ